ncbi:MAG: hypothetical protein JXR80_01305 [Deltaproteobacteria bacterium]|nr:hypothetical protein [Deltaproteobacteria bacterium]
MTQNRRLPNCSNLQRALCCIIFFILVSVPTGVQAAPPQHILLINSYHEGYKGTDDIVDGFRTTLKAALPEAYIKTEYLDSKNFSGREYDEQLLTMLRYKYRVNYFNLIVAADDYAFNLVERCYDELFAPTPVVFCGTNAFDLNRLTKRNNFVGFDERPSFKETLALIFKLRPETERVIVIHDSSLVGQLNRRTFQAEAADFSSQADFIYLNGLELEELLERLHKFPPASTAAFYFASVVNDHKGNFYSSGDALEILATQTQLPIFGGWEFNLGHGIVGGKLINLYEHGRQAGKLAARILEGTAPATLPKLSPSPNQFMFDDQQLQRFAIKDQQLPPESIIVDRPPTFYEQRRAEIFLALSILLAILVSAAFLFLYRSRARLQQVYQEQLRIEKSLRHSQAELTQALKEIKTLRGILPICSYCKAIRNDEGYYEQLEGYIHKHSGVDFSHTICPSCLQKYFPEYIEESE